MTIESEYKLKFAVEGVRVYECQRCFALVEQRGRDKHRQRMHNNTVLTDNIRKVIEELYGPSTLPSSGEGG